MDKKCNNLTLGQQNCHRGQRTQHIDPQLHRIYQKDTRNQLKASRSSEDETDKEQPAHFTDCSEASSRLRAGAATNIHQSDFENDVVRYEHGNLNEPDDEEYKSILSNLRRVHHFARKGWGLSVLENEYDFEEEDLPMRKNVVTILSKSNFSPDDGLPNITVPRIYVDSDKSMPLARVARQRGLPRNIAQFVIGRKDPVRRATELNNQRRRTMQAEAERQAARSNVRKQRSLALAMQAAREAERELQKIEAQQRESQSEGAASILLQRRLAENAEHEKRRAAAEELQRRRCAAIEHERTMAKELEASMTDASCPYRKRGGGTVKYPPQVRWDNRKYFEGQMPGRMETSRVQVPYYTGNRSRYNILV